MNVFMMVVLKEKSSLKMEHVKAATTSHTLMIPEENVLQVNGTCKTCELYSKPNEAGTQCAADVCLDGEILLEDGTCEVCEDYLHPDEDSRLCVADSCDDLT
jgi:hypothetical protein